MEFIVSLTLSPKSDWVLICAVFLRVGQCARSAVLQTHHSHQSLSTWYARLCRRALVSAAWGF
jgi:hypothetical protein